MNTGGFVAEGLEVSVLQHSVCGMLLYSTVLTMRERNDEMLSGIVRARRNYFL